MCSLCRKQSHNQGYMKHLTLARQTQSVIKINIHYSFCIQKQPLEVAAMPCQLHAQTWCLPSCHYQMITMMMMMIYSEHT